MLHTQTIRVSKIKKMEVNYFARPKLVRYETVELDDLVPLALVRDVADKDVALSGVALSEPDALDNELNEEEYETLRETLLAAIRTAQASQADQVGSYDDKGGFPDFPQFPQIIQIPDIKVYQPPAPLIKNQ